jgi:hypothetical protein
MINFVNFVAAYIRAAAALCIITLLTDVMATLFTGLGLRSKDHRTKYKYYRVAVYIMVLSRTFMLVSTCKSIFYDTVINCWSRSIAHSAVILNVVGWADLHGEQVGSSSKASDLCSRGARLESHLDTDCTD